MNREAQALKLFEAAIDLPESERDSFLGDACNGDSSLRRKVQALLEACDDDEDFLATHNDDGPASFDSRTPDRIGEYRIIREIGRGGMGIVYEAEHDAMQRCVALKVLATSGHPTKDQLARFYREARSAGQLHHTNIVPVFEVGQSDDIHFYTMQYIQGANLDTVIEQVRRLRNEKRRDKTGSTDQLSRTIVARLFANVGREDSVSERTSDKVEVKVAQAVTAKDSGSNDRNSNESDSIGSSDADFVSQSGSGRNAYHRRVASVGRQVAEALHYAHENGTLHRDIKPANLLLDMTGTVWILDFGLAKGSDDGLTITGDIVGTLRYMAPERFDGKADQRSDIYSLGLTLYELCTLQYAYDATDRASLIKQVTTQEPVAPRRIDPRIPRDLETIILKSLDRNPNRRYDSAELMAEDLRLFQMDHPIAARRISPAERVWRVCRRNPVVSMLALMLAALLIVVAAGASRFAYVSNQKTMLAESAALTARERLYKQNYESAKALRKSNQQGRRFDALEAVSSAAEILPTLGWESDRVDFEKSRLRTEAVAAMAIFDIGAVKTWPLEENTSGPYAAFSLDGSLYANTCLDSSEIRIGEVENDSATTLIKHEFSRPYYVIFTADGEYLLSQHAAPGGKMRWGIWPTSQNGDTIRKPLREWVTHYYGSVGISVYDHTVGVCRKELMELYTDVLAEPSHSIPLDFDPSHVVFADDGKRFAATQISKLFVEVWDYEDEPRLVKRLELPEGSANIRSLDWSSSQGILVVGLYDGSIVVWRDLDETPSSYPIHQATVSTVVVQPNEPRIFTSGWDRSTRVFDLFTEAQSLCMHGTKLIKQGFRRDGSQLGLISDDDSRFGLWKVPTNAVTKFKLDLTDLSGGNTGRRLTVHPINWRLAATAHHQRIEIWDLASGKRLKSFEVLNAPSICFDDSGRWLYFAGTSGLKRLPVSVTTTDGNLEVEFGEAESIIPNPTRNLSFSWEEQLMVASVDGRYRLVDLENRTILKTIRDHKGITNGVVSDDGTMMASGAWKQTAVKVWQGRTEEIGAPLKTLLPDTIGTFPRFSPNSKILAASTSKAIHFWDTETWEEVLVAPRDHGGTMGHVAFSKDNRIAVANKTAFLPQLIDMQTKRWLMDLDPSIENVPRRYNFSSDGQRLVIVGGRYGLVWDLGELRQQLDGLGLDW